MKFVKCLSRTITYSGNRCFTPKVFSKSLCMSEFHYSPQNYASIDAKNKSEITVFPLERIRNFSIIAHIDHGKSTLADRILELTGAISVDKSNKQVLDRLQVEKERGITVKAQSASVLHKYKDEHYLLNLIDTPGHVDFSHEVSRSLAACQGVILLVDANQGVEAQTVANFYLAFAIDLIIIPVLNKIDLKNADPEGVTEQLEKVFDIEPAEVLKVSAKHGTGVKELLDAIVERIPSPTHFCNRDAPFRALLFDSWYDNYKGVVCQILVVDGCLEKGHEIQSSATGKSYEVKTLSIMNPEEQQVRTLNAGYVGLFTASIKKPKEAIMGDTFHSKGKPAELILQLKPAKPMVYAGIFPLDQSELPSLKSAVDKLLLNDSSVSVQAESSQALGSGWRLGFLGLLHMDVFCTRLEQEHNMQVVITTPSVPYKIKLKGAKVIKECRAEEILISNPAQWPDPQVIEECQEPMVKATILTPENFVRDVITLCEERRGEQIDVTDLDSSRMMVMYKLPLSEVVVDFFDKLKKLSSGYASFDYEDAGFETSTLVKIEFKLNGKPVDELSIIANKNRAEKLGRQICLKLQEYLPRQQFLIAIQATVGAKVIARENIKPYRKDVTAKLYGGDVTRKMKLLGQQKEGKKRLRLIGNVPVPRDAFIKVLKTM